MINRLCYIPGGYPSSITARRQLTSLSVRSTEEEPPSQHPVNTRRSVSDPPPPLTNRPNTSKPLLYNDGMKKEYTLTNSNTMVFMGENSNGVRAAGANTSQGAKHNSIVRNRNKIAKLLGRYIEKS